MAGVARLATLAAGWALVVVGLILVPLPGPGWLIVGLGLVLLARASRAARSVLVRVERWLQRRGALRPVRDVLTRERKARRAPRRGR